MKSHFSIQLYKKRRSAVINESAHHRLHVPHLLATLAAHWKRLQIAVFCHANLSGRFNCCHAFNFACVTCYTQHAAQLPHTYILQHMPIMHITSTLEHFNSKQLLITAIYNLSAALHNTSHFAAQSVDLSTVPHMPQVICGTLCHERFVCAQLLINHFIDSSAWFCCT